MKYWIFQSKEFARKRALPYVIPWRASRYREDMKSGELAYLWLSGTQRGVYGWGHLASEPYDRSGTWAVDYELEMWLTNPVLIPTAMKLARPLEGLLILRMPVGTNFLISREEALAIADRIEPEEQRPKVE